MKKENRNFKKSFATTIVNCPHNSEVTNSSSSLAIKGYRMF